MGDGAAAQTTGRRPSILFVNQHYWPDFASTGQHLTDLAEHLAASGFDVHVLCSRGRYVAGRVQAPAMEVHNGVTIRRLGGTGFGRARHLGRLIDYAGFYGQFALRMLFGRRFDLVVTLTTPPLLHATAALASRVRRQAYGIWSMDLHPEAEFALGMLSPRSPAGRLLAALDRSGYRSADFVVELGACMRRRLDAKGVADDRLHTIPVWSKRGEIDPIPAGENPLRRELGLEDKFVVMYSGNAGLAHTFDEVLEAAVHLRDHEATRFVFVGNGPRREAIEAFKKEHRLDNVSYLDYFPRESIRYSLPLGDIHLLTLRPEFAGIAVPGKLYGIMAAGRPVLMVGPPDSAPAQTIREQEIGEVFPAGRPGSGARLAEAILKYHDDEQLRRTAGERARSSFLQHFEQEVACDAWLDLLTRHFAGAAETPASAADINARSIESMQPALSATST
jgi:colanic acid biosynthesis glycosyl transferase WcaI